MKLTQQFDVEAALEDVWRAILDVESVAGCVPGARVVGRIGEDAYKVAMKVKLGPVTMEYRGEVQIVDADPDERRAVMRGRAKEARGQGTAEATAELRLQQRGGTVRGEVSADVRLSGRAAAMGQGVIGDVANQMIGEFSRCLQARLTGAEPAMAAVAAPDEAAVHARSGTGVAEAYDTAAAGAPTARTAPDAPAPDRGAEIGEDVGAARAAAATETRTDGAAPAARAVGRAAVRPEAATSGAAQSAPGARAADRLSAGQTMPAAARPPTPSTGEEEEEGAALDALALARSVVAGRLREPSGLLTVLAVVALVAFLFGRRAGARRGGLSMDDALRLAEAINARR